MKSFAVPKAFYVSWFLHVFGFVIALFSVSCSAQSRSSHTITPSDCTIHIYSSLDSLLRLEYNSAYLIARDSVKIVYIFNLESRIIEVLKIQNMEVDEKSVEMLLEKIDHECLEVMNRAQVAPVKSVVISYNARTLDRLRALDK